MSLEALELPHHPSQQRLVDISEHGGQRRRRVSPIVFNPPPQERVEPVGDVGQRQLCLLPDVQVPNRLPHGLQRRWTDRWRKPAERSPVLWITDPPRPELVSEEVELDVRIRSSSPRIPAVNDLSLGGMHLQVTLLQACLKLCPDGFRFLLGPAVYQPVIRIPTPREVRICPPHPEIECVMQEKIR